MGQPHLLDKASVHANAYSHQLTKPCLSVIVQDSKGIRAGTNMPSRVPSQDQAGKRTGSSWLSSTGALSSITVAIQGIQTVIECWCFLCPSTATLCRARL